MNEYPNQYPTKCYNETNAFGITREEKEERAHRSGHRLGRRIRRQKARD